MPATDFERTLQRTLRLVDEQRRSGLHLGGQLYVSIGGRVVADQGLGEARPGEAMTREHLVPWMSAGKPVTAVAIGRFWDAGKLGLDDPVKRHLPEFAAHGKSDITIRHLLTHTSGIGYGMIISADDSF